MERYIAIDNVCAWPNLTVMPDGVIAAVVFNQPCHGLWEGEAECWVSEDGGRLWRRRGTPVRHEPGQNRMNVAAGLARNGDLVALVSGWTHRPRKGEGQAVFDPPAATLPPLVCRSSDGGRTWSQSGTVPGPDGEAAGVIPFGDIVTLEDGTLGACIYCYRRSDGTAAEDDPGEQGGESPGPCARSSWLYASEDDGLTWAPRGVISPGDANETAPLALPGGQILACVRTATDQHLELFRSTDCGRSWRGELAVSEPAQHPGHLLHLGRERVLLTYGDRRPGREGVEVRLSEDSGRTWSTPRRLADLEPPDLGYPVTIRGGDALLTAWYCSGIAAHRRYHMGTAVWRLEEVFG